MTFSKLRFSKFKKFVSSSFFLGALTHADIIEFSNFLLQLKNERSGSKIVWLFCYVNFERNYDVFLSPCILLNKNINFNKNKTELKMENPAHSFRETNLVLQYI